MTKHATVPASRPPSSPETRHEPDIGLERLVFFSDAVVAIAITLLALELRLPATDTSLTNAALLDQLLAIWPKYLGFLLSFMQIGLYWQAHHRLFCNIRRYNRGLSWINLLFLMFIAFLPFPTSVISEQPNSTGTIFYALSVAATGLAMASMWWYANTRPHLLRQPLARHQYRIGLFRQLVQPTVFLVSVGIALWNADVAKYFWTANFILFFFRVEEAPPKA